jgi:hypothetical protein
LDLPWRIAGALVLLFGQPAERIAALTIGQVKIDSDERVLLSPAGDWIDVPEPLATLLRTYLNCRRTMATAANPDSAWLFPGGHAGSPYRRRACRQQAASCRRSRAGRSHGYLASARLISRNVNSATIADREAAVRRFQRFTNEYHRLPWPIFCAIGPS